MVCHTECRPLVRFVDIENTIAKNGGRIVELGDPKLTHIVVDKRDCSRRKDLMKRTSTYAYPLEIERIHAYFDVRPVQNIED